MYEPRRVSAAPAESLEADVADSPFVVGPRRAMPTRMSTVRSKILPAAASVVLLAGTSAFALNLHAADANTGVPAPLRADDTTSRSEERTALDLAATESVLVDASAASPTPDASETASEAAVDPDSSAAALVAGSWEDSFGKVTGTKYAQATLSVRAAASKESKKLGSVKSGDKVTITDLAKNGYRQIDFSGTVGYVLDKELGDSKPAPNVYTGSTTYTGKTVLGLKPKAMVVYNAVTAKWSFSSIGGYRPHSLSNHQHGGAIDFMLTPGADSAKGWAVAKYLAANASAFDIDHIIFEQKIWTPYNPTWRPMADRGGTTANHYDHVHVSVKL